MKKLSMLLAFCLLSVSLCGCQSQLTSSSQSSEVSAVSASSTAQEGDPVVICLDESLEQDMEELIRYLMSTEQTPVFFAAPKYPAMLSKLAKGRTESYGDSARGPTWQSHEQRFPAALQ